MSTICSHMMQEILDMWRRCRQDPLSWKPVPRPALRCSMETRWDFWDVWDVWDVCHSSKGLIKIARIASQVQEALEEILPPISLHVALSLFPFALCNTYVVFSLRTYVWSKWNWPPCQDGRERVCNKEGKKGCSCRGQTWALLTLPDEIELLSVGDTCWCLFFSEVL